MMTQDLRAVRHRCVATALALVALLAVGCGSSSTGPDATPKLPPVTVDCTIVGTLPCQIPPTSTPTPTPTGSFTISGTVTDGTSGGTLPGISVVGGGSATSTDSAGHYTMTGVKAGAVTLTFSAASYTTQTKTLTLDANATVDVVLQRSGGSTGGVGSSDALTILSLDIAPVQIGSTSLITLRFSSGHADTFAWTFGDGTSTTTTASQVSHTYGALGSYVVTVRASNASSSATATNTAEVVAVPTPAPVPTPTPALTVTLTCTVNAHAVASLCNVSVVDQNGASVTASLTKVDYDWGDGQVSTVVGSPLASHTYAQQGTYIIRATVTANGITGSATKVATVS